MSIRYYGENGPSYLEPTMSWKRWLIRLDPVRIQTWQGIAWPERYLEGDAVARPCRRDRPHHHPADELPRREGRAQRRESTS